MTVKELIIKLMELETNLNTEVGISITRKDVDGFDKVVYVGTRDVINIDSPSTIEDPNVIWLEANIHDDSKIIRKETTRANS